MREGGERGPFIFKQRHTLARSQEATLRGHKRLLARGTALSASKSRGPQWPPRVRGRASPTNHFCHHTRVRRGDSLPHQSAQTFIFFELAGRHRKLGVPWPPAARKTAPTGPASRLPPYTLIRCAPPLVPLGALILHSQRLGAQRRAQGRIRTLWASRERVQEAAPTQKLGASNLDQDALLFLGECRSDGLELLRDSKSPGARNPNRP